MFDTWEDLFELCEKNRNAIKEDLKPGAAVDCVRTFTILPLRYGVVCGSDDERRPLPTLPPHLNRPQQVGSLMASSYAVLPMREGFLYALSLRGSTGRWAWDTQFRVSSSGRLYHIDPQNPWVDTTPGPFGSGGGTRDGWMFTVYDVDDLQDFRLLFSPDPLTEHTLARYLEEPALRDTLVSMDLRKLAVAEPPKMASAVSSDDLDIVTRFTEIDRPALAVLLNKQAFPVATTPMQACRAQMAPIGPGTRPRGVGIVVDDAIGITQALNAWRNDSAQSLMDYMEVKDEEGFDNKRKLTISLAIDQIKAALAEKAERDYYDREGSLPVVYRDPAHAEERLDTLRRYPIPVRTYDNRQHQLEEQQKAAQALRVQSWDKYKDCIDEKKRSTFMDQYERQVKVANRNKEQRAPDLFLWLQSDQLLNALNRYDSNDIGQGILFEAQMSRAMIGMNSTEEGASLLAKWCEGEVVEENLFWRCTAMNQKPALAELAQLAYEKNELSVLDNGDMQERLRKLTDIYDKANAWVEALDHANIEGPPRGLVVTSALMVRSVGSPLFTSELSTIGDKPIHWLLVNIVQSKLGQLAKEFRLVARDGKELSDHKVRLMKDSASTAMYNALQAGAKGPMAEVRLGGFFALLDTWNLVIKLRVADKSSRDYVQVAAAAASLMAVSIEIGAAAVEWAQKSPKPAVQLGAEVFSGGLRLNAGVLAAGVSWVGAVFDFVDTAKSMQERKYSLTFIYALRGFAQFVAGTFFVTIGLARSAGFLRYLLNKYCTRPLLSSTLRLAINAAEFLATRQVMAFMVGLLCRTNVVIFALTLAWVAFKPDELQKYLENSTFGVFREGPPEDSEEDEIEKMQAAVGSVL